MDTANEKELEGSVSGMKFLFLGGGNMASALISGLLKQEVVAGDILVLDVSDVALDNMKKIGVRAIPPSDEVNFEPDVVVLAVKPQHLEDALSPLSAMFSKSLVISIVAGVSIRSISTWLSGHSRIIRVMPNTPALIQSGISGMYGEQVTEADRVVAEKVVGSVGRFIWCDQEQMIDVVTAISGSGPAYVFYFIEALEASGIELGLSSEAARLLAIETFLGASRLAARSDESPSTLREKVTSKGGTTAAALASLNQDEVAARIKQAVTQAKNRATELASQFGGEN